MFNEATIEQLIDDVGIEVLSQLMSVFSAESTKLVQQLTAAESDFSDYARLAHSLKSCAKSYGADKLADVAAEIEFKAKNNDNFEQLKPCLANLEIIHSETIDHIPTLNS